MSNSPGIFTISLDVELYWGIRDVCSLDAARERLLGDREVVPRLLDLFVAHSIRATWATVGFLFFEDRDTLLGSLPTERPRYADHSLDPYAGLTKVGRNEREDPFHFAGSLVRRIANAPGQELGTHTFSHFYCLEDGQTEAAFEADLAAAANAARALNVKLESLVFPRNQFNARYLDVCRKMDIVAYRGNPAGWMYTAARTRESRVKRAARLVDAFVPLSGTATIEPDRSPKLPVNVSASRFLRPYNRRLARLLPLQLRRIKSEMTHAARTGSLYHLWWHPHNFGLDQTENMRLASEVLRHYDRLASEYGMRAMQMREVANVWNQAARSS